MKVKMPDGTVYDEKGRKCISLRDFLKENPNVIYFQYDHFNFKIKCKKLFASERYCMVATNGNENLMDLDYCETFEEIR